MISRNVFFLYLTICTFVILFDAGYVNAKPSSDKPTSMEEISMDGKKCKKGKLCVLKCCKNDETVAEGQIIEIVGDESGEESSEASSDDGSSGSSSGKGGSSASSSSKGGSSASSSGKGGSIVSSSSKGDSSAISSSKGGSSKGASSKSSSSKKSSSKKSSSKKSSSKKSSSKKSGSGKSSAKGGSSKKGAPGSGGMVAKDGKNLEMILSMLGKFSQQYRKDLMSLINSTFHGQITGIIQGIGGLAMKPPKEIIATVTTIASVVIFEVTDLVESYINEIRSNVVILLANIRHGHPLGIVKKVLSIAITPPTLVTQTIKKALKNVIYTIKTIVSRVYKIVAPPSSK